jgi:hypothetical protein
VILNLSCIKIHLLFPWWRKYYPGQSQSIFAIGPKINFFLDGGSVFSSTGAASFRNHLRIHRASHEIGGVEMRIFSRKEPTI